MGRHKDQERSARLETYLKLSRQTGKRINVGEAAEASGYSGLTLKSALARRARNEIRLRTDRSSNRERLRKVLSYEPDFSETPKEEKESLEFWATAFPLSSFWRGLAIEYIRERLKMEANVGWKRPRWLEENEGVPHSED